MTVKCLFGFLINFRSNSHFYANYLHSALTSVFATLITLTSKPTGFKLTEREAVYIGKYSLLPRFTYRIWYALPSPPVVMTLLISMLNIPNFAHTAQNIDFEHHFVRFIFRWKELHSYLYSYLFSDFSNFFWCVTKMICGHRNDFRVFEHCL